MPKISVPKIITLPWTVSRMGNRYSPSEARKAPSTTNSRPSANGSDPASRSRAAGVPAFRHQAINVIAARLVEAADARNNGDSQTVSLQTGWLVALNRPPVYEATKNAATQPTA